MRDLVRRVGGVMGQRIDHAELVAFRRAKDTFFKHDPRSPIPDRADFQGLRYFEPNEDLVFRLPVLAGDGSEVVMATSDGQTRRYVRSGRVEFHVGGEAASLTLLSSPGHPGYFVPFRDATSGHETYGAGRYLDLEAYEEGMIELDFNLAYNPYCAYSDAYSCPLPPPENWLKVRIEAGERDYR